MTKCILPRRLCGRAMGLSVVERFVIVSSMMQGIGICFERLLEKRMHKMTTLEIVKGITNIIHWDM